MFRHKLASLVGLVVGAGVLAGNAVQADTLPLSQTVPATSVPGLSTVTFARFNPALGTLTGVSLAGTVNTTASIQVFSVNATPENFTNATSTNPVTVTNTIDGLTTSVSAVAGPFAGVANPGLTTFPGVTGSNLLPTVFVTPANLNNYIITGPLNTVSLSYTNGVPTYGGSPTIPGTLFFGGTTTTGGTINLVYTYTAGAAPAPLPAVAPAGLALVGLLGAMKVRRSLKTRAA